MSLKVNMDATQKLISVKELIKKAKRQGISLGKGDPINRLRYFIKIGLLPHMERCQASADSPFTEGFMPLYTLDLLKKIENLKKARTPLAKIKKNIAKEQTKYLISEKIPGAKLEPPEARIKLPIINYQLPITKNHTKIGGVVT